MRLLAGLLGFVHALGHLARDELGDRHQFGTDEGPDALVPETEHSARKSQDARDAREATLGGLLLVTHRDTLLVHWGMSGILFYNKT